MSNRKEWTFTIEGMTCEHCARTIDEAVRRVPGVFDVATKYEAGTSRVVIEAAAGASRVANAIRGTGYTVVTQTARDLATTPTSRDAEEVDLLIIGAGSSGFAAAIRATELGARVVLVERGALGGTCVNIGCVPSKTLIRAAQARHHAGHHAFAGVRTRVGELDFKAVIAQKAQLVAELQQAKYWDVLASYPSIVLMQGDAHMRPDGTVLVDGEPVRARKVLLTTGAHPWAPPIPGLTDVPFLTSTTLMELEDLPKHLIAIGGGAVGLELAQAFARFGSRVTVLEALARIVPSEDADIGEALAGYLREEGLDVRTQASIVNISGAPGAYHVVIEDVGGRQVIDGDQLLVATGRRPNTDGLGLEEAGVRLGPKGEIWVDDHLSTSRPGVYAAGDVIGDPAFVYVAAYAGHLAADNALRGDARTYDLAVVPRVTFTDPAVASVGLTEAHAREQGIDVVVSTLPMSYVPRAIAARDTRGRVKLVADAATNLLVGAHILAPDAGDIIEQAVMAMRFSIRTDEIASLLHPYLTNAEAIKLACQTFDKDVAKLSCCAA